MFEKVNPYLREELNMEAAAHLCGCRCVSGSAPVGSTIQAALNGSTCAATCVGSGTSNYNANLSDARNDKKWS